MKLLTNDGSERSYPSYYLYSRLRGRVINGLDYLRRSVPEVARGYVDREHKWVYLQMNNRLRDMLWPFFFYREIRRVSEWLRLGDVSSQLESSLLSEEIKEIFLESVDITFRVERLETLLSMISKGFKGLKNSFDRKGIKAFEETFMNSFLSMMSGSVTYPALREFFRYMIDFRNLMSLYKYIRWNIDTIPLFLLGGNIGKNELRKALSSGDIFVVNQLFSRRLNIDIDNPSELEVGLYRGLRSILKRRYLMSPVEPVVIPYYLWNLHVESILIGL
ncbi:MAG: hypothetical protein ACK415_08230 [Thermodesulfovibrionales bacterium]